MKRFLLAFALLLGTMAIVSYTVHQAGVHAQSGGALGSVGGDGSSYP